MERHARIKCVFRNCEWSGHILAGHLHTDHDMTVEQFIKKFPDQPWASDLGMEEIRATVGEREVHREKTTKPFCKVFPEFPENDTEVSVFIKHSPLIPQGDEDYVFPSGVTDALVAMWQLGKRNRVWIAGLSGTGKTQLVLNAANRLGYEVLRVNGDREVTKSALLGEWIVKGSETVWVDGILPQAMKRGAILLIDEIDMLDGPTFAVLRPVLEDPGTLVLLEKGAEVIHTHPDFRVTATANTFGHGDMTGQFQHVSTLSEADRQRFSVFLRLDYLDEKHEREILKNHFPSLEKLETDAFLKVTHAIRQKQRLGEMESGFSPRQLINVCEKYLLMGGQAEAAFRITYVNSLPEDVAVAVRSLVNNAFPSINKGEARDDDNTRSR